MENELKGMIKYFTLHSFLPDTPFWNDPISSLMTEIDDNFLVSESPILLEGILRSIEGMQYWHLRVIGALVSQDELAATRLARFFRKNECIRPHPTEG
jgi:hypothetical protein